MRALAICSTLIVIFSLLTGTAVFADTSIYTGQPAADAGITFLPWGSGGSGESTEKTLVGTRTIKIDTGGWFQGGGIEFKDPAAIPGGAGSGDYLVFTVGPTMQSAMSTDTSDLSWYTRGSSSASKSYDLGAQTIERPKIQRLRFVFIDPTGKRLEVQQGLTSSGETGWVDASIPVAKFRAASIDSVKKILLFSDLPDTIYIGEIKIAQDTEQLKAEVVDDLSYAVGDAVPFPATVTAGLSSVRVSWDFDVKDGIQEDAIGAYVTHVFSKSGDYVVTVTVKDNNGIKNPYSTTIKVHIE
jgi:hypothetical protein